MRDAATAPAAGAPAADGTARSAGDGFPGTRACPGADPRDADEGYAAARVRLLQDAELSGPDRRRALSALTDQWLAALFGPDAPAGTALVAVGGYGHGELSPRSDLDLLLLHDGSTDAAALAALADRLWYPVWDLGLALDHSVRTPDEARTASADDLKVQLGLLEARHLAGDADLTAQLRTAALGRWRAQARTGLPELREYATERARRPRRRAAVPAGARPQGGTRRTAGPHRTARRGRLLARRRPAGGAAAGPGHPPRRP
ncbi:hypothetical protein IHE61_29360 [Streptomyces sp. GKU 257-1]|nr:hypothetical protein [Streptomyces sp. GKU 257-1]